METFIQNTASNYNRYFDQTWYDCTIDKVKEIVKGKESFTLFDIGAGNSVLEEQIISLGGKWIGFDYKPRKEGILKLNLEEPLPDNFIQTKPDVILLLEVIEHVLNPGQAMKNIAALAKPGTGLIITTPNPFWSVNRLKLLFLNIFPMFEKSDMDENNHYFLAFPHVLEHLVTSNEFEIIDRFTVGWAATFPKPRLHPRYVGQIASYFLRKTIEAANPSSKGMSYGIVAVKK